ncbi:cytosine/uracil/thiamine/allantoin permease [Kitasatospora acidiphila]
MRAGPQRRRTRTLMIRRSVRVWDPIVLAAKLDNVAGTLFALLVVLVATLSVNIAANVVSPAYDRAVAAG